MRKNGLLPSHNPTNLKKEQIKTFNEYSIKTVSKTVQIYLIFEVNFNRQDEACVSRLLHFVRWVLAH